MERDCLGAVMSVLIVTMPNDYHAQAVKWAIDRLGGSCEIFYPFDLSGGAQWTFGVGGDVLDITYRGERTRLCFDDFRSVWMRRPASKFPQEYIADQHERSASEVECGMFAASVLSRVEAGRFVVNPLGSTQRAALKPFQMRVAEDLGLKLPRTITSNSAEDIIAFWEGCGRRMVYKAVKPALWNVGANRYGGVPTTVLTDTRLLTPAEVQKSPGIYQEVIDKRTEVRATIIGRSVFAWEKSFPTRTGTDIDWRFMNIGAVQRQHDLPQAVVDQCFTLMDVLGLVFGCFDFAVNQDGEYVFLEVNPQGNWLWGDEVAGLFQLEAMAEFLMSPSSEFKYSGSESLQLLDFGEAEQSALAKQEQEMHYGDLMTSLYSSVSIHLLPPPTQAVAG